MNEFVLAMTLLIFLITFYRVSTFSTDKEIDGRLREVVFSLCTQHVDKYYPGLIGENKCMMMWCSRRDSGIMCELAFDHGYMLIARFILKWHGNELYVSDVRDYQIRDFKIDCLQ